MHQTTVHHGEGISRLRRTFLLFAGLLLCAASLSGVFYFSAVRTTLVKDRESVSLSSLGLVAGQLEQFIENGRQHAVLLASSLSRTRSKNGLDVDAAARVLDRFNRDLAASVCYVMDKNGTVVTASNRNEKSSFVGKRFAFRPYFQEALADGIGVYAALGASTLKRGFYFSAPVLSESGIVTAVAVIKMKGDFLAGQRGLLQDALFLLYDRHGMVFDATDPSWEFRLLWRLAQKDVDAIAASRQFGNGPWPTLDMLWPATTLAVLPTGERYRFFDWKVPGLPGWRLAVLEDTRIIDRGTFDIAVTKAFLPIGSLVGVSLLLLVLLYKQAVKAEGARLLQENALLESEARFRGAFESAAHGIALVAPNGSWLKVNRALCDIVGYSETELLKMTFQDITHPDDLETDLDYVRQMLAGKRSSYHMEKRYIHKKGHVVWILLSVSLVREKDGTPKYFVSQVIDVTERKTLENNLTHLADHDPLTGLVNRRRFIVDLDREVSRSQRHGLQGVLLWLDLDGFKEINDTLGHQAGDDALVFFADLVQKTLRKSDTLARLGGDEFAVILPETALADGATTAEKILKTVKAVPFIFEDTPTAIGVSIGVVGFPSHEADTATLMARADTAMYSSKHGGRGQVTVYEPPEPA